MWDLHSLDGQSHICFSTYDVEEVEARTQDFLDGTIPRLTPLEQAAMVKYQLPYSSIN